MLNLRSTNPVLARAESDGYVRVSGAVATIGGVAQKTAIGISIAVVGGLFGGFLASRFGGNAYIAIFIASAVVSLITYFCIIGKPERAVWGMPVYAFAEGAMLGAMALLLESILAGMKGATASSVMGLGTQAFIITLCVAIGMLCVYRLGLIRANKTFVAVLSTMTLGIMLAYLASFVMGMFGAQMPFLSLSSAMEGGRAAWIGIGLNVVILIVASLWLVVDFQRVEEATTAGVPRKMEWYFAFGIIVTLVWVYFEALKLAFRVAASRR